MLSPSQLKQAAQIAQEYDSYTPTIAKFDARIEAIKETIRPLKADRDKAWEQRAEHEKRLKHFLQGIGLKGTPIDEEDTDRILASCRQQGKITPVLKAMIGYCVRTVMAILAKHKQETERKALEQKQLAALKGSKSRAKKEGKTQIREAELIETEENKLRSKIADVESAVRRSFEEIVQYVEAHQEYISLGRADEIYREVKEAARYAK